MAEWISVNDKLPERQGRYLTHSIIAGQSLIAILWYEKYGSGFDEEVTHWMCLPEPPRTPKERGGIMICDNCAKKADCEIRAIVSPTLCNNFEWEDKNDEENSV